MIENQANIEQIDAWNKDGKTALDARLWDEAINYFNQIAELAHTIRLQKTQVEALRNVAFCLKCKLNFAKAMNVLNEALVVTRMFSLRSFEAIILQELSDLHIIIQEYETALELIYKAIVIHEDLNEEDKIGLAYLKIGEINLETLNVEQGLLYLQKAKKMLDKNTAPELEAHIYRVLGQANLKLGNQNKAFYYCLKSIEKSDACGLEHELRKNYLLMGDTYKQLGQLKPALSHYQKALNAAITQNDQLEKATILNQIADLYCKCGKYPDAITVLDQAVSIAVIHSNNVLLAEIYLNYARAFEGLEKYNRALSAYKKYSHIQHTLQEYKIRLKTEALEAKYDFEKSEKQKYLAIETLKLKDQFLANVSHEIKTPMHGILGLTEMLLADNPRQDQVEQLYSINESAKRLMSIIEDILYLSKINTGKISIVEKDFELKRYIEQLISLVQLIKKDKPITINSHIDKNVPAFLNGDPHRLLQILINILNNAIKFTHQGEVGIEVKLISKVKDKINLRFTVYDTGIGIEAANLERIFKAFEQIDNSSGRAFSGTGIGLNIVQQLVNILNGNIRVESEPAKGSKFHIELPFKASEKHELEKIIKEKDTANKSFETANILVVEDNKINQVYVKRVLNKWTNISFKIANDGTQALKFIENEAFDLILMDLQMPGMSGFEVTHAIRRNTSAKIAKIPIIALTANDSPLIEEKVAQAGMNGYLFKPFDEHELFHAMRLHIQTKLKENEIAKSINQSLQTIPEAPSDLLVNLSRKVDGNKAYMAEFLEIFLDQYPEAATLLLHHINQQDWDQVQRIAHRIKSTINIIGISDLYNVISAIDKHSRTKTDYQTIMPLYQQFIEIGDLRALQLEKELKNLKTAIKSQTPNE